MKTWVIRLLLTSIFLLTLFLNNSLAGETAGTLNVNLKGFPDSEGYAMVALFGSEQAYAKGSPETAKAKVKVQDQKALATFIDLQYGIYAVAVYHDRNANGKMDKNF